MSDKKLNRREFLRSCARNGLLSSLAIITGIITLKEKPQESSQVCISQGICDGCGVFNRCILPAAQSAKEIRDHKSIDGLK